MSVEAQDMVVERKRRAPSEEPERILLTDVPLRRRRTKSLSPERKPGGLEVSEAEKPADDKPIHAQISASAERPAEADETSDAEKHIHAQISAEAEKPAEAELLADVVPDVEQPIQPNEDEPSLLDSDQEDAEEEPRSNRTDFMAYKVQIVQQTERKDHHYGMNVIDYAYPELCRRKRDTITGRVSVRYIGTAKLFRFVKKSRCQMD